MGTENVRMGNRIAEHRERRQWNKARLAREAGVAPSYITRIEQGRFGRPSIDIIKSIADALGISVSELTDPPAPPARLSEAAWRDALMAKGFKPHQAHVVDQIVAAMFRPGMTDRQRDQILGAVATMMSMGDRQDEPV